ncbi:MAG: B12-binding domain-containing protein [Candidatus Heimdallarchaeota archaeon]
MTDEPSSALAEAVILGDAKRAKELTMRYLNYGMDPLTILEDGLARGVRIVGEKFEAGEYFLPDLVMGAEAMKAGIRILEPELQRTQQQMKSKGRIVIGTAAGDIHDIGKNIVIAMLAAAGFEVHDLGVDVSVDKFIETVRKLKPDIVGVSVLLRIALPEQQKLIEALRREKLRNQIKVIVGGAPVTPMWAKEIGADAYGDNAVSAVAEAKRLMDQTRKPEGEEQ